MTTLQEVQDLGAPPLPARTGEGSPGRGACKAPDTDFGSIGPSWECLPMTIYLSREDGVTKCYIGT